MKLKTLIISAFFLALALVLPLFTGQVQVIGSALCPLHLPVLLCGFVCGPLYALAVGIIAPLLRFCVFGMPPIFPSGLAMSFELATYGAVAGLLNKKRINVYVALISAMLAGRLVWGGVSYLLYAINGNSFTLSLFFAKAVTDALPGIALQIIIIPPIVMAVNKINGGTNNVDT